MEKNNQKKKDRIPLNILLLGIVSFLNDISSEMITPILPFFIESLGGAGIATGLVGGIRDSMTSLLKVISGYFSDKTGKRKPLVFSGYLFSSVFKILLALSKTWQHVLVFVGLERVGKGMRDAPRDAIISYSMPHKKGKAFGFHRAMDAAGAIVGSITAVVLFSAFGFSFKTIILLSAVIAFTSLIPLSFVKEVKTKTNSIHFKTTLLGLPSRLKLFLVVTLLFGLANFSYMFFILKAQTLFGGPKSFTAPLLLYVLYNIVFASSSTPFGALSDKIGRKKMLMFGYGLFALTAAGFAFFHSVIAYIFLFGLYGIVNGIVNASERALVADLSKVGTHGTSLGAYHTAKGLAALPASIIAGGLWKISPETTFWYGAVVSAISLFVFWMTRKQYK